VIRLRVPGALKYRDLAVRAVAAACKLVGHDDSTRNRDFDDQVVSAFGEAFNNTALHSYRGRPAGEIEIEIETSADGITIRLLDQGMSFDPARVPEPDLDALPESGLGLFIMKSFMDEVAYQSGQAGQPNILRMTKRLAKDLP
jgi:serine/threonine-protein kinase RsbW